MKIIKCDHTDFSLYLTKDGYKILCDECVKNKNQELEENN